MSLYGGVKFGCICEQCEGCVCECVCVCDHKWMSVRKKPGCVCVCLLCNFVLS